MRRTLFVLALVASPALAFADKHDESPRCPGEKGFYYTNYRKTPNPQKGGFVAHTATIEDSHTIVINPQAAVCGNALVYEGTTLSGNAIVRGNAEVRGSTITGDVILEGDVEVTNSVLKGKGTIRTGAIDGEKRTLDGNADDKKPGAPPKKTAPELAEEIRRIVQIHHTMRPAGGSHYEGSTYLKQAVTFDGACTVKIHKERMNHSKRSSFHVITTTTVVMSNVYDVLFRFYDPTLSAVSFQVENVRTKHASRRVGRLWGEPEKEERVGFDNRYVTYNDNTMESIELPHRGDAEKLHALAKELRELCK